MLVIDLELFAIDGEQIRILDSDFELNINDLSESDRIIYDEMISLIGNCNIIIDGVMDNLIVYRMANFTVDENLQLDQNYPRLNSNYFDYSPEEKQVIDNFIDLIKRLK